ncbi:hypothetical protein [Cupriavidus agavae]|uniref:Uncharacterized protein n=1 Tax=Cupriavidus agavae TaxID=1001822 RepID=A0A4Q7RF66_9BURK|nr:hypothetical protein [Cupriavidus agavae]RZT31794.1 hypothetical protein EV147_4293 [Cupriavidus agavae]
MTFVTCKRATLLIPSGPPADPERFHLFVLLTDPDPEGRVLLASFSSIKPGMFHDPTCIVEPGEHPFVTRLTWVNYSHCRIEEATKLLDGINAGLSSSAKTLISDCWHGFAGGCSKASMRDPPIDAFTSIARAEHYAVVGPGPG